MSSCSDITRVGVVGTGFISNGLVNAILHSPDFEVGKVLTRRPLESVKGFPEGCLTASVAELIGASDVVVECSGDAIHATDVILEVVEAGIKVVTMNSEFHVTCGSHFARTGQFVSEADGDQPGCLARFKLEIEGMGFEPVAYVNLKGFLNLTPSYEDMAYWGSKQQLSLSAVTSFTDGTKVEIERAFVANGLGATLPRPEISAATIETLRDLDYLVDASIEAGEPVSDFVLCKGAPPGILIVANNPVADLTPDYLPWSRLRTTEGRGYVLVRHFHLTFMEILQTLRRINAGEGMLLTNSAQPRFTVAAVAKKKIKAGTVIETGAGGFEVRGVAVPIASHRDAVPICLIRNTRVTADIEPGEMLRFHHAELADTAAYRIYQDLVGSHRRDTAIDA